ncbi:hypothetical protein FSP39_008627 [Pinctada imbricata]|uniref:Uncharacterized protein n=1 Tax=Pinctada imbricata TaxID=66713 RepID=A0AA89BQ97_PINIB|nr:hypothetical protein FSP39_008627 [Pinctada imbricata]
MYTTLPHDKINDQLSKLIKWCYIREGKIYICTSESKGFFSATEYKSYKSWTCSDLCSALSFLLDNIYVRFGENLYKQVVGIPMGTNCAPLVADLFLYTYEKEFIQNLQKQRKHDDVKCFISTSRYLDDILTIDNPAFEKYKDVIYPQELTLNKANFTDTETPFLDLNIKIVNGEIHTSVYDKRDDFGFNIVNFPWLDGDVPRLPSYGIYISQLIRYARAYPDGQTAGRFAGFSVAVSESENTGYHVCFDYGKDSPLPNVLIPHVVICSPKVRGRFVEISNKRDDAPYGYGYSTFAYVNLCEVEVYVQDCFENCNDCVCSTCKDGFYGDKCNSSCSIHCGGDGLCNGTDGRCNNQYCEPGYYGEHCSMACSSLCVGNSCNYSTGYCDRCNGSFFGINCSKNCPLNCESCESQTECSDCNKGYYGSTCIQSCMNCGMEDCEKEDGKCVNDFCKSGYFTRYCNQSCSGNCKGDGSCGFLSGVCDTCSDGFYGVECERECVSECKLCSNSTSCTECYEGLFGALCDRTCPPCGDDGSCNIHSGLCNSNSCRPGFYGDGNKCDKNCSTTCGSDGSCDVVNGTCSNGCKSGFSGETCEDKCPENCIACDQVSKNCTDHGCNVGFHDRFCSSECPENCGGKRECGITDGLCLNGCKDGWEGSVCMEQATDGNLYANIQLTETMNGKKGISINEEDGVSSNNVVLKMDADENTYYNTTRNILGIEIEELKDYVSRKKSRQEFSGDFAGIPYGEQHPITAGKEPQNILKNRYKTTFPYDHSRVILKRNPDYINANYIERKCEQYWPEQNVQKTYGQFKLTLTDEKSFSFYVLRDISLEDTKLKTKRSVYQFHFTTWPDHGTPDPFLLVKFHRRVISQQHHLSGPMLVHCSAGIGRTGTFIALDALHREGQNAGRINVEAYVRTMRKDRMNMIQNADQYEMLHDALIEAFQWQDTSTTMDSFPSLWETISKDRKPINQQRLKQEYDVRKSFIQYPNFIYLSINRIAYHITFKTIKGIYRLEK